MFTPTSTEPGRRRSPALFKLAAVGVAGLLVGAGIGLAGSASAEEPADEPAPVEAQSDDAAALEVTPEDEAVWERFDECLTENGVPLGDDVAVAEPGPDAPEPAAIEIDEDAIEACEDILDDLSGDGFIDDFELSPEDEALFERYDDCLVENGVPSFDEASEAEFEEMTEAEWEAFDAAWEAAAEVCDPILADLSDEVLVDGDEMVFDVELSPEDEAVFERYDDCLAENGVPMFDESSDSDVEDISDEDIEAFEEAYEAAAETCDPILDDLSEDVMFGGFAEGCDLDEIEPAETGEAIEEAEPADA